MEYVIDINNNKQLKKDCLIFSKSTGLELKNNINNCYYINKNDKDSYIYNYELKKNILKKYLPENYKEFLYSFDNEKPLFCVVENSDLLSSLCIMKDKNGIIKINNQNYTIYDCIITDEIKQRFTNYIGKKYFDIYIEKELTDNIQTYISLKDYYKGTERFVNNFGYKYSLSDFSSLFLSKIDNISNDLIKENYNNKIIKSLLADYSFGIELETNSGFLPMSTLIQTGFIPLRDGSINGYEYTSIPLSGMNGITKIENFTKEAKVNCSIDKFCSMHLHIGNHNFNKKELVAYYILMYQIQNEIFDFVPPYKRSEKYFASKKEVKDHCKPLKSLGLLNPLKKLSIAESYSIIRNFVIPEGMDLQSPKWNNFSRYFFINLLPYFKKKHLDNENSGTIEIRIHEPTLSFEKILLWLIMNISFINYVKENSNKILLKNKISLFDIIDNQIKNIDLKNIIIEYIESRELRFLNEFVNGNYNEESYLHEDKTYSNKKLINFLNE